MNFDELELKMNEEVSLRGTIVFELVNAGSKSEGVKPFLYKNRNAKIRVFKKDDNPFENASFNDFDGVRVEVIGSLGRGNVFCVSEIKKL